MELSDPVWLAIIAAFSAALALISPIILAALTNRARRQEKEQDYARQDAVAAAALRAANTLASRTEHTAHVTNEKLDVIQAGQDVIHTLVNSNMTAAMQSELDAVNRQHAMMLELIELKKKSGLEPSVEALAAVEATRKKIVDLKSNINGRAAVAAKVDSKNTAPVPPTSKP